VRRELLGVTDAFAELEIPRRPWVEPDLITSRFRQLATAAHPDKGGSDDRLARLNQARQILASPGHRLRHLALVSFPDHLPRKTLAPDWALFESVGHLCQRVREWSTRRGAATSALEKAVVLTAAIPLRQKAVDALEIIRRAEEKIDSDIRQLDERWPHISADEMLELADAWTFLERSGASLRDAAAILNGA